MKICKLLLLVGLSVLGTDTFAHDPEFFQGTRLWAGMVKTGKGGFGGELSLHHVFEMPSGSFPFAPGLGVVAQKIDYAELTVKSLAMQATLFIFGIELGRDWVDSHSDEFENSSSAHVLPFVTFMGLISAGYRVSTGSKDEGGRKLPGEAMLYIKIPYPMYESNWW